MCPIKPAIVQPTINGTFTRSATAEKFKINGTPNTFIGDATRLWNIAPDSVTNAKSIQTAKKSVKMYCRTFPI